MTEKTVDIVELICELITKRKAMKDGDLFKSHVDGFMTEIEKSIVGKHNIATAADALYNKLKEPESQQIANLEEICELLCKTKKDINESSNSAHDEPSMDSVDNSAGFDISDVNTHSGSGSHTFNDDNVSGKKSGIKRVCSRGIDELIYELCTRKKAMKDGDLFKSHVDGLMTEIEKEIVGNCQIARAADTLYKEMYNSLSARSIEVLSMLKAKDISPQKEDEDQKMLADAFSSTQPDDNLIEGENSSTDTNVMETRMTEVELVPTQAHDKVEKCQTEINVEDNSTQRLKFNNSAEMEDKPAVNEKDKAIGEVTQAHNELSLAHTELVHANGEPAIIKDELSLLKADFSQSRHELAQPYEETEMTINSEKLKDEVERCLIDTNVMKISITDQELDNSAEVKEQSVKKDELDKATGEYPQAHDEVEKCLTETNVKDKSAEMEEKPDENDGLDKDKAIGEVTLAHDELSLVKNELAQSKDELTQARLEFAQTYSENLATINRYKNERKSEKEQHRLEIMRHENENEQLNQTIDELNKKENKLNVKINELKSRLRKEKEKCEQIEARYIKKLAAAQEEHTGEMHVLKSINETLKEERDDIRDRFSKVAGSKLTDDNADIADLSDPNRAMKLSERLGGLYDDQWTDAFQLLTTTHKFSSKDTIMLLLQILKDCVQFCTDIAVQQMESLENVLLYPCQDVEKPILSHSDTERPRIHLQEMKSLKALRRTITVNRTQQVKEGFFHALKKSEDYKQVLDDCRIYMECCAEICWLMVVHNPPLYLNVSINHGDKMDTNMYSAYSASGNKVDYLVWPPLFNGENGGLISKGVVATFKSPQ